MYSAEDPCQLDLVTAGEVNFVDRRLRKLPLSLWTPFSNVRPKFTIGVGRRLEDYHPISVRQYIYMY